LTLVQLAAVLALVSVLGGCARTTPDAVFLEPVEVPAGSTQRWEQGEVLVEFSEVCDAALGPLREVMEARSGAVLNQSLRVELRTAMRPAYDVCSIEELRTFERTELDTWSATLIR
jgi:hypothetical protein